MDRSSSTVVGGLNKSFNSSGVYVSWSPAPSTESRESRSATIRANSVITPKIRKEAALKFMCLFTHEGFLVDIFFIDDD